jgi:hypothetical protein
MHLRNEAVSVIHRISPSTCNAACCINTVIGHPEGKTADAMNSWSISFSDEHLVREESLNATFGCPSKPRMR